MEYTSTEQLPADHFLGQAISALEYADPLELGRLAACASSVAVPVSRLRYRQNREIFVALLRATGRNLRLLHRATEHKSSDYYLPTLR